MNVLVGGNPLNRRDDNCAIYTQPNFMPPLSFFESFPKIHKSKISSFIENLYFLTMEENGFSYFYPNIDTGVNLCRFEWHYEYKGNPYELRLGLSFEVLNGSLSNIGFYIVPHYYYECLKKDYPPYELAGEEHLEIIDCINGKVDEAIKRIESTPRVTYNILYYIDLGKDIGELIEVSPAVFILPSRIIDGKIISAVVIKELGHSYLSAKRSSDEKVNLLCAIISLVSDRAKVTNVKGYPISITPVDKDFELSDETIGNFYPGAEKSILKDNFLESESIALISFLLVSFDSGNLIAKNRRKLINVLFSFYSAKETESINQTVGLVSYVACLDAIAKELFSEYRDTYGSRKALVQLVMDLLARSDDELEIDKWSKRIYNVHRSSYVHGANIKFEAFSQNMDGNNFAGLPKALPTEAKPVSKQYEYNSDYITLKRVTSEVLIKYINMIIGVELPNINQKKDEISFKVSSTPEAHIGMPNNGWIRIL